MTPAERIAWAVEIVRKTRCLETAHTQTRVTSDVIRKACKAAGVCVLKDRQEISRIAMRAPRAVSYRLRPAGGGWRWNEHKKLAKRERDILKARGWEANAPDTEEVAEIVGINLHEPE